MENKKHNNVFGQDNILDKLTDLLSEGGMTKSGIYNHLSEIYSLGFTNGISEFKRKSIKKLKNISDEK